MEVNVSIDLLLGIDHGTRCTHEVLGPNDLADRLPSKIIDGWSTELQRGWQIFCHLLRRLEDFGRGVRTDLTWRRASYDLDCICKDGDFHRECDSECYEYWEGSWEAGRGSLTSQHDKRSHIRHLWAAVQTELLTYRRIHEDDSWLSSYFDLDGLLTSLHMGTQISMPLLDRSMIRPYCCCGRTGERWSCALREDLEAHHFNNLDVWDRTSFISLPCHFLP